MGGTGLDAKQFIHLPAWAKALCLATLACGIAASLAVMVRFWGTGDSRDWVLIGISGVQFLVTTFVVVVVLFLSQTDANIATLEARAEAFLADILPRALARITLDEDDGTQATTPLTVARGERRDIFGHDYAIGSSDGPLMRLWLGVNVSRIIVIYRFVDPVASRPMDAFVAALHQVFRFSFAGAEAVGYDPPHVEPLAGVARTVSVWLTASVQPDFLTDPAAKLFWSQDVAMMCESILRTARRHRDDVRLDLTTRPRPQ